MQRDAIVNNTHSVVEHRNTPCTFAVNKCVHDDPMQEIGKGDDGLSAMTRLYSFRDRSVHQIFIRFMPQ